MTLGPIRARGKRDFAVSEGEVGRAKCQCRGKNNPVCLCEKGRRSAKQEFGPGVQCLHSAYRRAEERAAFPFPFDYDP